jgi:hypothetical protein
MLGTDRDPAEIQTAQQFANAALMEHHTEPGLDPLAQVDAAPAYHAVHRQIGTFHNPTVDFGLLRGCQKGSRPGMAMIGQALEALIVVAANPIAQGLPVHRTGLSGGCAGMTIQHQGNRQKTPGNTNPLRH